MMSSDVVSVETEDVDVAVQLHAAAAARTSQPVRMAAQNAGSRSRGRLCTGYANRDFSVGARGVRAAAATTCAVAGPGRVGSPGGMEARGHPVPARLRADDRAPRH